MGKIVSVSELTRYLATILKNSPGLQNIIVRGEISNFKCYTSGHCYFDLKDKNSILPCVMFRGNATKMRFTPQGGMQVLAEGAVSIYEAGGRYQLYVSNMVPDGVGELALAFEQLKEKLLQEGLFDEGHKKPLPLYPKTIGIVTSAQGAVLRDIFKVTKSRFPNIQLVLRPVPVQGAEAGSKIAEAIKLFNEKYPVDLLIVGRGGGSLEDLWAFNEEIVVRAIYNSKIPIISAVGHETDVTLADFVADKRAATPSQAGEIAVRDCSEIKRYIDKLIEQINISCRYKLQERKLALENLISSEALKRPVTLLEKYYLALEERKGKLLDLVAQKIEKRKADVEALEKMLELLNPEGVLRRGYAMVLDEGENSLTSIQELQRGAKVKIRLGDGKALAEIVKIEEAI